MGNCTFGFMENALKVRDIAACLEAWAPRQHAESYDNVGLLVGSMDAAVTQVMVSLDCTEAVVAEAILVLLNDPPERKSAFAVAQSPAVVLAFAVTLIVSPDANSHCVVFPLNATSSVPAASWPTSIVVSVHVVVDPVVISNAAMVA